MPIVIHDPAGTKGRAPSIRARVSLLFIEDCPHNPQKQNHCEVCIGKSMNEAIRRALISEGYIPREPELHGD